MKMLVASNRIIDNGQWFSGPQMLEHYLSTQPEIDTLLFAFWSWKVSNEMLKKYKCYGTHTGPLLEGKGKGGSPIDNLQALDIEWTTLCVFEMTEKIDEGRVLLAIPIFLATSKSAVISAVDTLLYSIVGYLRQDNSSIPERFKRLPNAK